MNIQDAIKSNKPFKRKGLDDLNYITMPAIYRYSMDEILADDWELKQEPRKVTLYQYLYEYSCKKMLMSLETNETWDQYNCDRDDCKLLKTFTREIEF